MSAPTPSAQVDSALLRVDAVATPHETHEEGKADDSTHQTIKSEQANATPVAETHSQTTATLSLGLHPLLLGVAALRLIPTQARCLCSA